jgi:potassium-transporting ATPase KdpC subunit
MIRPAFTLLVALTALTGLVYPLAVTGLAQVLWPTQANGQTLGALGETFSGPGNFSGRPSATTPPTNATASSGSNLGPTNPAFLDAVAQRVRAVRAENPDALGPVPAELVTTSASGLDPHLSVEGARFQAARVAKARGVPVERIEQLIAQHVEGRFLGLFGEPRVNVVRLNAALAAAR